MQISTGDLKKCAVFVTPSVVILAQWFDVGGIRLSWLLSLVFLLVVFKNINQLLNNKGVLLAALFIVVYPLISVAFGKADEFDGTVYLSLQTGLVYMLFVIFLNDKLWDSFISGALFSCVLFAVWGCYETITGHYILFNNPAFTGRLNWVDSHYPGVAFANTNDLAQYLVMLFPIASAKYVKKHKLIFAFATILIFFVVFHTGSRLSMIIFVAVFFLAYIVQLLGSRTAKSLQKLFCIGVAVVVVLYVLNIRTGIVTNIIENFLVIDGEADYYTGRAGLYINLLKTAITLPLGGFGTAYAIQAMPPHNLFLFILCDYGWGPAILFALLLIKLALMFFEQLRFPADATIKAYLFASVCLFPIMSIASSTNEQRKIIWLMMGIFIRYFLQYKRETRLIAIKHL